MMLSVCIICLYKLIVIMRSIDSRIEAQESGWAHRGGDVDKEGVAIDTHGLQEGVASNLPLSPLPPRQETP